MYDSLDVVGRIMAAFIAANGEGRSKSSRIWRAIYYSSLMYTETEVQFQRRELQRVCSAFHACGENVFLALVGKAVKPKGEFC